jgi:flagellar motor switch protein FliG
VASPSGIRKAALLLMGLEPTTAAELLKAADPEVVTRIAAELAYLEASGQTAGDAAGEPVRQFAEELRQSIGRPRASRLLQGMLEDAVGAERTREILERISAMVDQRDPFLPIRSADPEEIAEALKGESPQVAALVLTELPPKVSAKLLPLLADKVRAEAVRGMTSEQHVAPETRMRVASVVRSRLAKSDGADEGPRSNRQEQLRKVAVLLRDLGSELRDTLIQAIAESDADTSVEVQRLMVMWEDVAIVSDRSLQDALRAVDARKLALAMYEADEATGGKLRSNMSERQIAMIDEEASLLSKPDEEQIDEARNEFLNALRDLAANNSLSFEES